MSTATAKGFYSPEPGFSIPRLLRSYGIRADDFPFKPYVLAFSWLIYAIELLLDYRQLGRYHVKSRPEGIRPVVNQEKFDKANAYGISKIKLDMVQSLVSQIQFTAVVHFDGFTYLWQLCAGMLAQYGYGPEYEIATSVVFVAACAVVSSLLSLPFKLYSTFVVEERHGFNKQTLGLFFADLAKGYVIGFVIGAPLISSTLRIIQWAGPNFYIYVWAFMFAFSVLMISIYPTVIQPLFNKVEPLPSGELRTRIEQLAARIDFPLTKLYVIDGSRRSGHSNAYLYGFFRNKRIVLYDTLIEQTSVDEACAILGHELGHWKLGHTLQMFAASQAQSFLLFYLFGLVIGSKAMYHAFGFAAVQPVIVGFFLFQMLYSPVDTFVGLLFNVLSRANEYAAALAIRLVDAFSEKLGYAKQLQSGLVKLQVENLGNMNPDTWYSAYHFSHPPIVERLAALGQEDKQK